MGTPDPCCCQVASAFLGGPTVEALASSPHPQVQRGSCCFLGGGLGSSSEAWG